MVKVVKHYLTLKIDIHVLYLNAEAAVNLSVGDETEQHNNHRPEQTATSPPPPPCHLQHGQQCAGQRGRPGTVQGHVLQIYAIQQLL